MIRKKRVVAFGVFDLLHPGHLAFLAAARKRGDELVVVVTRDARARAEKGRAPVFDERERLVMVRSLRMVDRAVLGDPPGCWRVLDRLRPDAIAVGHDQRVPPGIADHWRLVRLPSRERARYRTSRLRARLMKLETRIMKQWA